MTAMTIECATPRLAAGAKPPRRARVQSRSQRHALGKAEVETGQTVSSPQQLFCSFDGTAFLIRALGSPVQVFDGRGGVRS
jgi:hypothetical protein